MLCLGRLVRWLVPLLMMLAPLAAGAVEPGANDLQRARAHFEAGSGLYQLGRYEEATREFSAGYALSHRPQFALNIGQCYRMLGRYEDARDMIRRFLAEAPADAPERASATKLLNEVEQQIRRQADATTSAPAATSAPPAATSAPALTASGPAASPPHRSRRGLWIALGVTGAVLVVGAALTIGLVAAFPTETVPSTGLGTVRFGP
jgi:tetratricopeptide (TPR) repeat protein